MEITEEMLRNLFLKEDTLWRLSEHLGVPEWPHIGRELGLKPEAINNIKLKCKDCEYRDYANEMLLKWHQKHPQECNVAKLVATLKKLDLNSTASNILQEISSFGNLISSGLESGLNAAAEICKIWCDERFQLGTGSSGTFVFKGKYESRDVAVKEISKRVAKLLHNEKEILSICDGHPNIIRYYGMGEDKKSYYLALQLCQGNLIDYITGANNICGDRLQPITLLKQVTDGLNYLHQIPIIHRDIKPANILITLCDEPGKHKAVISDFGISKLDNGDKSQYTCNSQMGTAGFKAYEILEKQKFTSAVDIFSLGCVYYFVVTNGKQMFYSDHDVLHKTPDMPELEEGGALWHDIIIRMINRDLKERPSCLDILKHPALWDSQQILKFLESAADLLTSDVVDGSLVAQLEQYANHIFNDDWKKFLIDDLSSLFKNGCGQNYDFESVRDLILLIRNKSRHYDVVPEDAKKKFGRFPEGYVDYFTFKFPKLLLHMCHIFGDFEGPIAGSGGDLINHRECDCQYRVQYAAPELQDLTVQKTEDAEAEEEQSSDGSLTENFDDGSFSSADSQEDIAEDICSFVKEVRDDVKVIWNEGAKDVVNDAKTGIKHFARAYDKLLDLFD